METRIAGTNRAAVHLWSVQSRLVQLMTIIMLKCPLVGRRWVGSGEKTAIECCLVVNLCPGQHIWLMLVSRLGHVDVRSQLILSRSVIA